VLLYFTTLMVGGALTGRFAPGTPLRTSYSETRFYSCELEAMAQSVRECRSQYFAHERL
jgi:hypothetical protein